MQQHDHTPSEQAAPAVCDHTSVGMLIWRGERLLLIERKKYPWGFAPPAGHVDGDASFEIAALREVQEEVGLTVLALAQVAEGRKENRCRRVDGGWHYWRIYQVTVDEAQEAAGNALETRQTGWYSREELAQLAQRTEAYLAGQISEEAWQAGPGLETVWYEWLRVLSVIPADMPEERSDV